MPARLGGREEGYIDHLVFFFFVLALGGILVPNAPSLFAGLSSQGGGFFFRVLNPELALRMLGARYGDRRLLFAVRNHCWATHGPEFKTGRPHGEGYSGREPNQCVY